MNSTLGPAVIHPELTENARRNHDRAMPYVRPKDAATLIILDKSQTEPRILFGRRHMHHRFMPGKYVFPGGRFDLSDRHISYADDLHPDIANKLSVGTRNGDSPSRLRGLAICAIRETYEEAGLFIAKHSERHSPKGPDWQAFADRKLLPTLAPLRLIGRAITPTGRSRRFDTRFFAVGADHIADRLAAGSGPSGELEDLCWMTFSEAHTLDLPRITREILIEFETRLERDPQLTPGYPLPFFFMKGKSMVRAEIK